MNIKKFFRDFICIEKRDYKFRVGQLVASCLAGFVGGVVVANIVWITSVKLWMFLNSLY